MKKAISLLAWMLVLASSVFGAGLVNPPLSAVGGSGGSGNITSLTTYLSNNLAAATNVVYTNDIGSALLVMARVRAITPNAGSGFSEIDLEIPGNVTNAFRIGATTTDGNDAFGTLSGVVPTNGVWSFRNAGANTTTFNASVSTMQVSALLTGGGGGSSAPFDASVARNYNGSFIGGVSGSNPIFTTSIILSTNAPLQTYSGSGSNRIALIGAEYHGTFENIIHIGTSPSLGGTMPNAIAVDILGSEWPSWAGVTGGNGPRFAITYSQPDSSRQGWTIGETNLSFGADLAPGVPGPIYHAFWVGSGFTNNSYYGAPTFTNTYGGTSVVITASQNLTSLAKTISSTATNDIVIKVYGSGGIQTLHIDGAAGVTAITDGLGNDLIWGAGSLAIGGNSIINADGSFIFGAGGEVAGEITLDSGVSGGATASVPYLESIGVTKYLHFTGGIFTGANTTP